MSLMNLKLWEHVTVAITHNDGSPVRFMRFQTVSYGDLPRGGKYFLPGWWRRPADPDLIEAKVAQVSADFPAPYTWRIVDESEVPKDRSYRNAVVDTGIAIEHDMVKARELHRQQLRNERTERMLLLDYDWMQATREKDVAAVAAVDAQKQALLDVTDDPRIDAARTIDELKAVTLPEKV